MQVLRFQFFSQEIVTSRYSSETSANVYRAPTGSGKSVNWLKQIPCMEKSWNLKINETSWNFGMRLLSGCQYLKFFLLPSLA